jgi:uncharacterized protein (TIGR02271 family)
MRDPSTKAVIPLVEQQLHVDKQLVVTGTVKITTRVEEREERIHEDLLSEEVELERVAIGREVDAIPPTREEAGVTIIPVVRERVIVTKRWLLVEELHVRKRRSVQRVEIPVPLRSTRLSVERNPATQRTAAHLAAGESMTGGSMNSRTITAMFDSAAEAADARARLHALGISESDIRLSETGTSAQNTDDHKSFWESVKDFFIPDDDRETYTEGLRRGSTMLTARVTDERTNAAVAALEESGAVDIDRRTQEWQASGWSGTAGAAPVSGSTATASGNVAPIPGTATTASRSTATSTNGTAASRTGAASSADALAAGNEERLPVVEERLRVGKREVDRGSVRVRSYVVEQPVHEDVRLREEHVEVERRPVSAATGSRAAAGTGNLLQERTIELNETAEEAVVQKDAVVTEEVVVKKFTGEKTQGIDDTLRHTEVEVDDSRTGAQPTRSNAGTRRTQPPRN